MNKITINVDDIINDPKLLRYIPVEGDFVALTREEIKHFISEVVDIVTIRIITADN